MLIDIHGALEQFLFVKAMKAIKEKNSRSFKYTVGLLKNKKVRITMFRESLDFFWK